MRVSHPKTHHEFDPWHVAQGMSRKLATAATRREWEGLEKPTNQWGWRRDAEREVGIGNTPHYWLTRPAREQALSPVCSWAPWYDESWRWALVKARIWSPRHTLVHYERQEAFERPGSSDEVPPHSITRGMFTYRNIMWLTYFIFFISNSSCTLCISKTFQREHILDMMWWSMPHAHCSGSQQQCEQGAGERTIITPLLCKHCVSLDTVHQNVLMLLVINRLFFKMGTVLVNPSPLSSDQWLLRRTTATWRLWWQTCLSSVSDLHQDMDMRVNQTHIMASQGRPSKPQIIHKLESEWDWGW